MITDKRQTNRTIDLEEIYDIYENIRNVANELKELLANHSDAEDKAISELLSRQTKIEEDVCALVMQIKELLEVWNAIKVSISVLQKLGLFLKWIAGIGSAYLVYLQFLANNGK